MTRFARNTFWKRLFLLAAAAVVTILSACTTLPTPSPNYDSTRRIVFPVVATGPGTIDGVANEAAWTGSSFKFPMVHGGGPTTTFFRGVADATNIYLYTEVEDPNFSDSDVLVIGLNPSNAANDYRRLHIFPCYNFGCPGNGGANPNPLVQYWKGGTHNGTTWTWGAPTGLPAGFEAKVFTAVGGTNSWAVEVKLPRGAEFVDSNYFGLFVDVVKVDTDLVQATQFTWPPDQLIAGPDENSVLTDLTTGTPAPVKWGNATLNTGFGKGVSLYGNDITSNHGTDGSLIRLNAPNTFFATASNFSTSGGALVAANSVKATFKIANFGLGGGYVPVPGSVAPTANIPAASAHTFESGTWTLSGPEVTAYTAHPHQCIQVELTSTDQNTVILTPSAQRNMDFVSAGSPFRESAVVTTKGLERKGDRKVAFTLRESFVNFDPRLTWTTKIDNAVPAGKRVYRTEVAPASDLTLGVTVDPPRIKIPSEAVRIPPGTGGELNPAVKVAVRAGEVVTIISSGSIDIEGQPVTAAGQPMKDRRGEPRIRTAGARRIGALIGSFDEFKASAFVIGNASTFKVPAGAQTLFLKINDDPNQHAGHKGEGYGLQVTRTPMEPWMVASNPELAREVRGDDVIVTLGANLPTWQLRGERDTGKFIRIGDKTFRAYESAGSYGYMVREIR